MLFSFGTDQQFHAYSESGFVLALNNLRQKLAHGRRVVVYLRTQDDGWLHVCEGGYKWLYTTRGSSNDDCRRLYQAACDSFEKYQMIMDFCGGMSEWLSEPKLTVV